MEITRKNVFEKGLVKINQLIDAYPEVSPFESVRNQIKFLIELEEGTRQDSNRLKDIIIGVITVREIEDRDMEVADLMYDIVTEVKKMKEEHHIS